MLYKVDGVRINFCTKDEETPSLTALIPVTFSIKNPVHNCSELLYINSNSHTTVGGNLLLHLCVLTRDGSDHPS